MGIPSTLSHTQTYFKYPEIVVIGDSIAQGSSKDNGYAAFLAAEYAGKMDVLNRGAGGYNSRQVLARLQSGEFSRNAHPDVRLFIVHIGTNDACTFGLAAAPVQDYVSNLQQIIAEIHSSHPEASIILLTPSRVSVSQWADFVRSHGLPEHLGKMRNEQHQASYSEACEQVAAQAGVGCVRVHKLHEAAMKEDGLKPEELFNDGLHYTRKGYAYINRALLALIQTAFPHLAQEKVPEAHESCVAYQQDLEDPEVQMAIKFFSNATTLMNKQHAEARDRALAAEFI